MPAPKFSSVFNLKPKKAISSTGKKKKKSQIAQEEGRPKALRSKIYFSGLVVMINQKMTLSQFLPILMVASMH